MKFIAVIFAVAGLVHTSHAQMLTGSFDWTVTTYSWNLTDPVLSSGTATFTYDTVSAQGTITDFVGSFGTYMGAGAWSFTVLSPDHSVSDLLDLGPGSTTTNTDPPWTLYYVRSWNFVTTPGITGGSFDGSTFSAIDQEFNYSETSPRAIGAITNIAVTVPEPSSVVLITVGAITLLNITHRREKKRPNQTLHPTAFRAGCYQRAGDARRSVTHPAWADCAPSLPQIPIYACLPEGCR